MKTMIRFLFASLLMLGALSIQTGCSSAKLDPAGAFKGDLFLYQAKLSVTSAYSLLDAFVTWEYQNRVLLGEQPKITKAADNIRRQSPAWFKSAHALIGAYEANPTPDNKVNVQKALAILQAALTEAAGYMTVPPPPPSK